MNFLGVLPHPKITGGAVALHCYKPREKINRKMGNLTPCEIVTPENIICNFTDSLICWVRSFSETYLSDIDNIVSFENTTPSNQNKKVKIKECRAC